MENIPDLKFSCNWNGKFCSVFSVIRSKSTFYKLGAFYNIMFKEKNLGLCQIMRLSEITGAAINQTMAMLDTGYSLGETLSILAKMNHCTHDQLLQKEFYYIVCKQISYKIPDIFAINNI